MKKEFKGTPGPWIVDEIDDDDLSEMSSTMIIASGLVVACVGPSNKTQLGDDKNNALLIATSPRLLSALQLLVRIYDDKSGKQWTTSTKRRALDEAHATIAQALGESE